MGGYDDMHLMVRLNDISVCVKFGLQWAGKGMGSYFIRLTRAERCYICFGMLLIFQDIVFDTSYRR